MTAEDVLLQLPREIQDQLADYSKTRGKRVMRPETDKKEEERWSYYPPNPKTAGLWMDRFVWLPSCPVPILELAVELHPEAQRWELSSTGAVLLLEDKPILEVDAATPLEAALLCLETVCKEQAEDGTTGNTPEV